MTEKTDENTILFRSHPQFYDKEKSGVKPNTIREIQAGDLRFKKLADGTAHHITILNTDTCEKFTRKITDISFWKDFAIISWKNSLSDETISKIIYKVLEYSDIDGLPVHAGEEVPNIRFYVPECKDEELKIKINEILEEGD